MQMVPFVLLFSMVALAETPFAAKCNHRNLTFVAHQDDDLLFMNPDLIRAIHGGECATTVYLTAGDANQERIYWSGREDGIRAAYAWMAGSADRWQERSLTVAGKQVHSFRLRGDSRIRVIFMRLPDGGNGNGFERYHFQSLKKLWAGALTKLTTVDARESFTRAELVDSLGELISSSMDGELRVRTLDRTAEHGWDHSDHYHSALFASLAYERLFPGKFPTAYRGYNITQLPQNLTVQESEEKNTLFVLYARHDTLLCPDPMNCTANATYRPWLSRQYHE